MHYSTAAVEPRSNQALPERIAIAATAASTLGTDVPSPHKPFSPAHQALSGLSLTELLVTISLTAILAALTAPALGEFFRRSNMQSLSHDFIGAMHKARAEAVNRNTCASVCKSSSTSTAAPQCNASGADGYGPDDWQMGWIVFLNPNCTTVSNSDPASPGYIISVRQASDKRYTLRSVNNKTSFSFGPQGGMSLGETGQLRLTDTERSQDPISSIIYVDVMGRTRIETNASNNVSHNVNKKL